MTRLSLLVCDSCNGLPLFFNCWAMGVFGQGAFPLIELTVFCCSSIFEAVIARRIFRVEAVLPFPAESTFSLLISRPADFVVVLLIHGLVLNRLSSLRVSAPIYACSGVLRFRQEFLSGIRPRNAIRMLGALVDAIFRSKPSITVKVEVYRNDSSEIHESIPEI